MKCLHRTYFLSALSPCVQGRIKATLSSQRCLHDQKVSTLRVTHSKTALEDATKSVNRNKKLHPNLVKCQKNPSR